MPESSLPDFVVAGTQKCATTWLYRCLDDHPDIFVPDTDSVGYFNMNYHKGDGWYRDFFSEHDDEDIVGEESPGYLRDRRVPERMADTVPDAKLIFMVRNPVDRAFSHYWHEKSKSKINFEFEEVFENYDLFQNWVEPGFYYQNIQRFDEHFPGERIKVMFFRDLAEDDEEFIKEAYSFVGVDPNHTPEFLNEKVNESRSRLNIEALNRAYYKSFNIIQENAPQRIKDVLRPAHKAMVSDGGILTGKSEYERGMREKTREKLELIFADDVKKFSSYVNRDLSHWFKHSEIDLPR